MITIRRIRPGEAGVYQRVRLAALKDAPEAFSTTYESALARTADSWHAQAEEAATGEDRAIFFAFDGQEPAGMAAIYRDPKNPETGEILQMWVSPSCRRQGVGRQLMNTIVTWAQHRGFRELQAGVTSGNQRAIPFYESYGFQQTQSLASSTEDEVALRLTIEALISPAPTRKASP